MLVVEDERPIAELERLYLTREGFEVHAVGTGDAGIEATRMVHPGLIVLDVGLPDLSGVEVYRALRGQGESTPCVFTVERAAESDALAAFGVPNDHVLAKPFSPRDLVTCVRTRLRGMNADAHPAPAVTFGSIRLEAASRSAVVGDSHVTLTATEFHLLAFLMSHPGRVFTREQLLASVWGEPPMAGGRTIDVHIAQIRSKLGSATPIRTVRGVGYAADD